MEKVSSQRLFVLIGIPGSGKTTLSSSLVDKFDGDIIHVSRDAVRNNVGNPYSVQNEKEVYRSYIAKIATCLKLGHDVIADSTNLSKPKRDIYFAIAEAINKVYNANIEVVAIHLDTPLDVCMHRNSSRCESAKVPESVIESMHSKIEDPEYDEGFSAIFNNNL